MDRIALGFAAVAAALHLMFFLMESVFFARPAVQRRFGVATADAAAVRPWALNQGYYNLFLALAVVVGIVLAASGRVLIGQAVVITGCSVMLGAGIVLACTDVRMLRAAGIQALPPFLAILLLVAG